jgi:ribonuclease T2
VRHAALVGAALALALATSGAQAQGGRGGAQGQGGRGGAPGDFDFYVLALSWSPGFCAREGERRSSQQCSSGKNLGFVVHGLWPQHERGFPSQCGADRSPSRIAMEEARGVYPDEGLARHEWRMHGTCSGLAPAEYFRAVRQARDRVRVPEQFQRAGAAQSTTPLEIERAFAQINPGLRPDTMAVVCRREELQEMRFCLEKDLRSFRSCPQVARAGCSFGSLRLEGAR